MFAVSGIMQAMLLVMCICWKVRQRRLGIDDFGHPLSSSPLPQTADESPNDEENGVGGERFSSVPDEEIVRAMMGEDTPLLKHGKRRGLPQNASGSGKVARWLKNLRR